MLLEFILQSPGSRAKKHIYGDDGERNLKDQHNVVQPSYFAGEIDSIAVALDGVHPRLRIGKTML